MRFSPLTENQIKERGLLPPGDYDFEVVDATECQSKTGNDQIKLKLKVFADSGERIVFDYLVATESCAYKTRHFCETVDLLSLYDSGQLTAADVIGRAGKLELAISKDKTGQYPDSNKVRDYLTLEKTVSTSRSALPTSPSLHDDNIPF